MRRVLLVVPLGASNKRLNVETWQSITALEWPGVLDIFWMHNGAPAGHFQDLADKLNRAAAICLDGNYDALFIVEYDMVVPADALVLLAAVAADVVYGLYCARGDADHRWLLAQQVDEYSIDWPKRADMLAAWGNVVDSAGVGTGCTLIRADALRRFTFRHGDASPDWYLAVDARAEGLRQQHHCGVVCGHILNDTQVIYPDAATPTLYRLETQPRARELSPRGLYRVLPGQAITVGTGSDMRKAGQLIELNPAQAAIMLQKEVVECV